MDLAVAESLGPEAQPNFTDGFGERRQAIGARGERLEVLRLSSTLGDASALELSLRERASRLSPVRDVHFAHLRAVILDQQARTLLVFSDYVPGVRLSSLLAAAEKRSLSLDLNAVRCLLRQLVRASAAWCDLLAGIAHGAIGPERIIITPDGQLVLADGAVGAILEQLRYSRDRYWNELRVPLPPPPAAPAFDARTDMAQIGLVCLALVLGRRLTSDVYPTGLGEALGSASVRSAVGVLEPLSPSLREWLGRAMQLDARRSFRSALEAAAELDGAIGPEEAALERDAFHMFQARCLTLDVRRPPTEIPDDALPDDPVGDDVASDVDLTPRIEALRAFLARYPLHSPPRPGTPPLAAAAPAPVAPAPAPVASAPAPFAPPPAPFAPPQAPYAPAAAEEPASVVDEPFAEEIEAEALLADLALDDEVLPRRSAAPIHADWTRRFRYAGIAVLAVGSLIVAAFALGLLKTPGGAPTGTYSISTNPVGVQVVIDSVRRGVTPLGVELPPGQHTVELVTDRGSRQFPITIKSGGEVSQFFDLPAAAAAAASPTTNGELQVRTDPPAAAVAVDGRSVGRSPVSVADLPPGPHTVQLASDAGTVTERVLIEPGKTASLFVPLGPRAGTGSTAGWVTVAAPADVQVFESDRFIGSNRIDRIMLPVGRHDLDIVNESLGYRERRSVQITAGQVSSVRLNWPNGTLAINAVPWAEAFVDGMPVGETPIGSIQVPIGVHEIVLRHPDLGERRTTVTVTLGAAAKVGADLRTK
ncbi:MAG TPA: PEGA domain-containing protein [Vicinamibacterales bacterium]|jgi:hypothetical protein